MREDRGPGGDAIRASLDAHFGLSVASVTFLPIGNDLQASVYRVVAADGDEYFLKIRSGPPFEPGLVVPRALIDFGIENVLAPLRTRDSALWCRIAGQTGYSAVLYPFIAGENAKVRGLTDDQWRTFGATLQAIHSSGLESTFGGALRREDFALPAAVTVRRISTMLAHATFESLAAARFAAFWRNHRPRIDRLLSRAEELGVALQVRRFDHVVCHADIHGANLLVGTDDRIWIVDWDGPIIAPRERDLLFVVGSRIGRPMSEREEDRFFEGYGPVSVDPDALVYYRYERKIEDVGEIGERVFLTAHLSERAREREREASAAMHLFDPGGDFDLAETVLRSRWPPPSTEVRQSH